MSCKVLADLLFPNVTTTAAQLEQQYPARPLPQGAKVTRIAPSPTGFMHLGNLYGALADDRIARQSDGVFYLRIEDTDQKREVAGGVETILKAFDEYGFTFDEGVTETGEKGDYGPYYQSRRKDIYHVYVRELVLQGKAYPCFLTEQELDNIRQEQTQLKLDMGCYGEYARYRNSDIKEIEKMLEQGVPHVIRYRSEGDLQNRIEIEDKVRGTLDLPENNLDVVLLKADGLPTYHFAHVVDDHLMRTNLVVRGEEWLATLPIHVQLFKAMGWQPPAYLHTAHLMKMDGGSRRKLSKRLDPELALDFYSDKGYPVAAVKEYLMTLLNSNFEEWRTAHPDAAMEDFKFSAERMSVSGALFDIDKLDDVSRGVISRLTAQQLYDDLLGWAARHDDAFHTLLQAHESYVVAALDIGRGGKKPRKDITYYSEMKSYLDFYFDSLFNPDYTLPERVDKEKAIEILDGYAALYDPDDEENGNFAGVRTLTEQVGYATNMKEFRNSPDQWPGNVADVSMVIRIAVTGRQQAPDLFDVMRVLGKDTVLKRLDSMKNNL